MSDSGKPPLTRREIREREEAARRAASGQRPEAVGQRSAPMRQRQTPQNPGYPAPSTGQGPRTPSATGSPTASRSTHFGSSAPAAPQRGPAPRSARYDSPATPRREPASRSQHFDAPAVATPRRDPAPRQPRYDVPAATQSQISSSHGAHAAPAPAPQIRSELPAARPAPLEIRPEPARSEPPSRRSMHQAQAAAGQSPSGQHAVVRPPTGSTGTRSLDATGRLTPVHETAVQVPIQPTAPPVRQSSLRPASLEGAPGTPPPAQPLQGRGGAPGVGASHREFAPTQGPAQPPAQAEAPRLSAFAAPAEQGLGQAAGEQDAGPSSPFAPVSAARGEAVPAWGPVADPPTPAMDQDAQSPFEPVNGQDAADDPADRLFPPTPATSSGKTKRSGKGAGLPERPPAHSFAWLRYLILIVVTFVLGILVWKLVSDGSSPLGLEAPPTSIAVHVDPPSPPNGIL